jgi:hypothetical protein
MVTPATAVGVSGVVADLLLMHALCLRNMSVAVYAAQHLLI